MDIEPVLTAPRSGAMQAIEEICFTEGPGEFIDGIGRAQCSNGLEIVGLARLQVGVGGKRQELGIERVDLLSVPSIGLTIERVDARGRGPRESRSPRRCAACALPPADPDLSPNPVAQPAMVRLLDAYGAGPGPRRQPGTSRPRELRAAARFSAEVLIP